MITLCSYNVHSGVGTDGVQNYRRIGELLREHNVDIALLQEMDTRPESRDIEQDVQDICADHFQLVEPSPALQEQFGWYGNAIATRFDVVSKRTIDVSQGNYQPRNLQEIIVKTPQGLMRIINTHKGLKQKERHQQFHQLCEHVESLLAQDDTPLLVAGDFNEWQFFTSAFGTLDKLLKPHKTSATFPTALPIFRLDRVWSRPANLVTKINVLKNAKTRIYSDHYPVIMEIDLP